MLNTSLRHGLLILALGVLSPAATAQYFDGGIMVGLTASQIDGDSYSGFSKVGIQGGGFIKRLFSYQLAGQMEIRYIQKGSLKTNTVDDPTYYRAALHYIDMPLLAQYIYNERVVFELGFGPEILLKATEEDENGELPDLSSRPEFHTFTVSAIAGLGVQFLEVFTFHARFNYSVIPIREHPSGQTYLLNQGQYSNVLSFGICYHIGRQ